MDAGRKCATASTTSAGTLKVTLAYTADETQMVSDTGSCQSSGQMCTASVQVNGTDNFCVSAVAEMPRNFLQIDHPKGRRAMHDECLRRSQLVPPGYRHVPMTRKSRKGTRPSC